MLLQQLPTGSRNFIVILVAFAAADADVNYVTFSLRTSTVAECPSDSPREDGQFPSLDIPPLHCSVRVRVRSRFNRVRVMGYVWDGNCAGELSYARVKLRYKNSSNATTGPPRHAVRQRAKIGVHPFGFRDMMLAYTPYRHIHRPQTGPQTRSSQYLAPVLGVNSEVVKNVGLH